MTPQELVERYLHSRGQSATVMIGRAMISIDCMSTKVPIVQISWPSLGARDPITALSFAADLTNAASLALGAERIIASWGGEDQWREDF